MKWSELKKMVEEKLEEIGHTDIEIDYIDFSQASHEIEVYISDKDNDMAIH